MRLRYDKLRARTKKRHTLVNVPAGLCSLVVIYKG